MSWIRSLPPFSSNDFNFFLISASVFCIGFNFLSMNIANTFSPWRWTNRANQICSRSDCCLGRLRLEMFEASRNASASNCGTMVSVDAKWDSDFEVAAESRGSFRGARIVRMLLAVGFASFPEESFCSSDWIIRKMLPVSGSRSTFAV